MASRKRAFSPAAASPAPQAVIAVSAAAQKKPRGTTRQIPDAGAKPAVAAPNVLQELAVALGRAAEDLPFIRKTGDRPPRVSIIDVAMAVTGKNGNDAAEAVRAVLRCNPDLKEKILRVDFPDKLGRQRRGKDQGTPTSDVRTMVEIVMQLPGKQAKLVRRQAATVLVRYMGGDEALVEEVRFIASHIHRKCKGVLGRVRLAMLLVKTWKPGLSEPSSPGKTCTRRPTASGQSLRRARVGEPGHSAVRAPGDGAPRSRPPAAGA